MTGADDGGGRLAINRAAHAARLGWDALPPTGRVGLLGVLASAVVAVVLGLFISHEVRGRLLDAEARGLQSAVAVLEPSLPDLTVGELDAVALGNLDRLVDRSILDAEHVRVKLWTLAGRILYADDRSLIGQTYADVRSSLADAVALGVRSEVTDLDDPENELERGYQRLVEFYVPVHDAEGRVVAVFEIYEDVRFMEEAAARISAATWLAIGSGLAILLLFLVTLMVAAVRSIGRERDLAEARAMQLETLYAEVHESAEQRRSLLRQVVGAHEDERRRLVGELHDSLAGELIRVLYGIRGLIARGARPPEEARSELADLEQLVEDVEAHLRAFMSRIRPASLDRFGLAPALEESIDRFHRESRIDIRLRVRGSAATASPEVSLILLRAVEEALVNVRKHARASRVLVLLVATDRRITLSIDDDGIGWPVSAQPGAAAIASRSGPAPSARGLGLAYLDERIATVGGAVRMERSRLGGARLRIDVPLEET